MGLIISMVTEKQIQNAKQIDLIDMVIEDYDGRIIRGSNHIKISCIFHNERTPSLVIYENSFYCFGCNEGGDSITWVMKVGNVGFEEAVKYINKRLL